MAREPQEGFSSGLNHSHRDDAHELVRSHLKPKRLRPAISSRWRGFSCSIRQKTAYAVFYFFYFSFLNGKPNVSRNLTASFLLLAVVTIVTAMPNTSLISSSEVSGKIVCSFIPSV